jgi:hypothetical protein
MSSELFKILYCSRNFIGGGPAQNDAEISQILATARANNSRQSVTGALLFNSGCFAQVLEGPRTAIEQIFERIQRDPRHGDVTVLESGSAARRDFPEWSMAHVQPPSGAQATGVAATLDQALSHPENSGREVLELLRNLVVQED